jgi:hypothetical protein
MTEIKAEITADILERAADLIERAPKLLKGLFFSYDGWIDENGHEDIQFEMTDEQRGAQCYCTMGAVKKLTVLDRVPAVALATYLGLPYVSYRGTYSNAASAVYAWNDRPERTKEEVVQALRGAAQQVRDGLIEV